MSSSLQSPKTDFDSQTTAELHQNSNSDLNLVEPSPETETKSTQTDQHHLQIDDILPANSDTIDVVRAEEEFAELSRQLSKLSVKPFIIIFSYFCIIPPPKQPIRSRPSQPSL
ncbi:hypothetical protein O181_073303 [Austropuccinia psidii MF-1]|uniref:Uncharacterized protein n=1 Tax=Austropuccinia psidii MF-1 TaxID=1389203 RepID=A0A9Q3I9X7_9BASI|nr:hypothetical protein [Austropuccinia psidii MF-1]